MTEKQLVFYLVDYEIKGAWWTGYIRHPKLQELAGRYFAWKVLRKFARQKQSNLIKLKLKTYVKHS
jgi:hypothetical protein